MKDRTARAVLRKAGRDQEPLGALKKKLRLDTAAKSARELARRIMRYTEIPETAPHDGAQRSASKRDEAPCERRAGMETRTRRAAGGVRPETAR